MQGIQINRSLDVRGTDRQCYHRSETFRPAESSPEGSPSAPTYKHLRHRDHRTLGDHLSHLANTRA